MAVPKDCMAAESASAFCELAIPVRTVGEEAESISQE